jgi:squalene-associated FAD-dependent desaturase
VKSVVVLGGGFAGLAAAIKLTQLGHRVRLVERRQTLGGRAFSFTDPTTGDTVDNGQHLFMKCYHATLELLETLGAHEDIVFQDEFQIEFRHPKEGVSTLRFSKSLPPPLNVLVGFLRFKAVGLRDVLSLRKMNAELRKDLPITLSVTQWLTQCKQTKRMQEVFWNPLCLAALNESPNQASAKHLQAVLVEGFFSSSDGALLGYSQVGLSNLLSAKAQAFLKKSDQTLNLGLSATQIEVSSAQKVRVHFANGQIHAPDAVICALPPQALSTLLRQDPFSDLLQRLSKYRPSPILSVNLWYDRPCLESPLVGMLGTQMEWAFNKAQLYGQHDQASQGHMTLIASAARALAKIPHKDLISLAHREFQSVSPLATSATLLHGRVICEHRATQTLPLGEYAPQTKTRHPNLLLAGDWVDTGLPPTIESAVRSGFNAANMVHQT